MKLKSSKSSLKKKAESNTNITKKVSGVEETVKAGTPLDHTLKHDPKTSNTVVGMSKGITKNMDNYESLRVDVWLSDTVSENETKEEAIERIEAFIDEALEQAIKNTIGE